MVAVDQTTRITIVQLPRGVYDRSKHACLADRGMRRYLPFSFDFDSTPMKLANPEETWDEPIKARGIWLAGRGRLSA